VFAACNKFSILQQREAVRVRERERGRERERKGRDSDSSGKRYGNVNIPLLEHSNNLDVVFI